MDRKTKRRAWVLAGFLIVMTICTVLSRAAASVLVAQVQVEKPGRGKLSYSYGGNGTVVPTQEKTIFLWADQQVEWAAEAGTQIKAGECLIRFRMEYLQRAIQNKQAELTQLEIQMQQQQISARGTARVPTAERALQNLKDAKEKLQEAREKEEKAQSEYDQFGGSALPGISSGRSETVSGQAGDEASGGRSGGAADMPYGPQSGSAGDMYGNQQSGNSGDAAQGSQKPESYGGVSGGTSGSQQPGTSGGVSGDPQPGASGSQQPGISGSTSDGQQPGTPGNASDGQQPGISEEDPGNMLPDDSNGLSSREQELKSALQQAQADVEAARQAVAQAQTDYGFALKEDSAQNTNEANAMQSAQLGVQSLDVQVGRARQALEELTAYQNAGGKICAEQDCTVLLSGVQTGAFTTGAEVMVTGSGGWKLKGLVDAKDREKLKAGTEAEIRLGAGKKKTVRIESVAAERPAGPGNSAGENDSSQSLQYCWYARLPDNMEAENGNAFTWNVNSSSAQEYEQLIPLTALREDTAGAYCLILSEEKNMLGTVQTAKRVPVTVLEKDAQKAAVTSTLKQTDQIIASSEKYVEEGDRVRIKE